MGEPIPIVGELHRASLAIRSGCPLGAMLAREAMHEAAKAFGLHAWGEFGAGECFHGGGEVVQGLRGDREAEEKHIPGKLARGVA